MEPVADTAAEFADAPPLQPRDAVDFQHLSRMTFGEPCLEAEVLALFDRQAETLLARMHGASAAAAAAFAHTLKGSATGIGAWRVAAAAQAVEREATGQAAGLADAVTQLGVAIAEARAAIAHQIATQRLVPHEG
jgi:HPt (histidine-containing phosphotransfer) domain-containing protein